MPSFSSSWLDEREPADVAARSPGLSRLVGARLPTERVIRVIDLGAGTGSNVRYLVSYLPHEQQWQLVDADRALLDVAPIRMEGWSAANGYRFERGTNDFVVAAPPYHCRMTVRLADLTALVDEPFHAVELVTASALLDLVSEAWLSTLAARCAHARVAVLFALTYDGRIECFPEDPGDNEVRDLVNRHQRTDKGFGRALGPDAVTAAERLFAAEGYEVRREPSDWMVPEDRRSLQQQLIEGWASAATELAPDRHASIDAWRRRRLLLVETYRSKLVVGHEDVAAWPLR